MLTKQNYQHDKYNWLQEHSLEQLYGVQYDPEEVPALSRSLADSIKHKLRDVGFDRYKLIVQVDVGEQRGERVKMAARCFWDADTDRYAQDIFMNIGLDFSYIAVFCQSCYFHLNIYIKYINFCHYHSVLVGQAF
uniref:Tctex1 domain containing 2 n=1 Tax=Sinocyclocheilus grahami TaxID=75366 RepID=A0A672QQ44_SINGR